MYARIIVLAAILFSGELCFAQEKTDYVPIKSSGLIPAENLSKSYEKYFESRKNVLQELRRKDRLLYDQFYLESNYWIDGFQHGGKVLYGTEFNRYLDKIADLLLADQPWIRNKIHFFVVKSSFFNAFTTDRGNIYINLGLLAKVRSEAELAYIMSHEINHFIRKHIVKGYLKEMDIELFSYDNSISKSPVQEELVRKHNYSQMMEFEADTLGFEMLSRTRYNLNAAVTVCELLKNADSPIGNEPIQKSFFENRFYSLDGLLPDSLACDSLSEQTEDEEDQTHPGVPEREELMCLKLGAFPDTTNRFDYIVSAAAFDSLRALARFELSEIMLNEHNYSGAIYNSFLLGKSNSRNVYLKKNIAFALNAMMLSRRYPALDLSSEESESFSELKNLEGFFSGLSVRDFNLVVLGYLLNLRGEVPADEDYKAIFDNAMYNLVKNENEFLDDMAICIDTLACFSEKLYGKLIIDSTFSQSLARQKEAVASEAEAALWYLSLSKKERKKLNKKKLFLNKEKFIVMDPPSMIYNYSKGRYEYIESEQNKTVYDQFILGQSQNKEREISFLNPITLDSSEMDKFNDYAEINKWMFNLLDFGESKFSLSKSEDLKALAEKYHSRYVLWSGIISIKELPRISDDAITFSVIFIFPAFFTILPKLNPRYHSLYFTFLFDMETNRICYQKIVKNERGDPKKIYKSNSTRLFDRIF